MGAYVVLAIGGRILVAALAVSSLVVLLLCAAADNGFLIEKAVSICALASLVVVFCDFVVGSFRKKVARRNIDLLTYECDPSAYLAETDCVRLRTRGYDESFDLAYFRVRAYLYTGRRDEAERLASRMELAFHRERAGVSKVWMARLLCDAAERLGRRALQEGCEKVIEASKPESGDRRRAYAWAYLRNFKEREALRRGGDLEGLVGYYDRIIRELPLRDRLSRVECRYAEAKALEALGRAAEAREAWRYVASYGSRLPHVKEAQDVFGGSSREAQGGNCEERPGADQEEVRS